jgi:adenylate cyclase
MEVIPKGVKNPITIYEVGGIYGSYNLMLPEKREIPLVELEKPLPVKFSILSGKHACNTAFPGTIARLAEAAGEAEIFTQMDVNKLANLKVSIFDLSGNEVTSEIYAKVIKSFTGSQPGFRVNFTSMPAEAKAFLQAVAVPGKF